jgi:threonine aldolase
MRQVGVLAAAGRYAVDHQLTRLAEDHRRARRLAEAVAQARPGLVDPELVDTNIVVLDLTGTGRSGGELTGPALAAAARAEGVLVSALGPRVVRLVTHLGVDDEAVEHAALVLEKAVRA